MHVPRDIPNIYTLLLYSNVGRERAPHALSRTLCQIFGMSTFGHTFSKHCCNVTSSLKSVENILMQVELKKIFNVRASLFGSFEDLDLFGSGLSIVLFMRFCCDKLVFQAMI